MQIQKYQLIQTALPKKDKAKSNWHLTTEPKKSSTNLNIGKNIARPWLPYIDQGLRGLPVFRKINV